MKYINVKGTHDLISAKWKMYKYIEAMFANLCVLKGYNGIETPIIEHSELFTRSTGDSSDVVRKQMYDFLDKGGRSITLRPEITAAVIRSFVNNKMYVERDFPVKLFYTGPAFRYERPKKGTYRQFRQMGVESIGCDSVFADVECIASFVNFYLKMDLNNAVLRINSLGDETTRLNYATALREHFSKYIDNMCPDCKERLAINPLRILDCKVEHDHQYIEKAPKIGDFLSEEAKERYEKTKELLVDLGIEFVEDSGLVRGLDYYSHIVFEYIYTDKDGKTLGALGGGGHYDKLVEELGGPELVGVGFSIGMERLCEVLIEEEIFKEEEFKDYSTFYIAPLKDDYMVKGFELSSIIESNGIPCDMILESKSIKAIIKRALRRNAEYLILIGEEEFNSNTITVRNLENHEQETITVDEFINNYINIEQQSYASNDDSEYDEN